MSETQRKKFELAACEAETNNTEENFDRLVKKLAKAPLPKKQPQLEDNN